MKKTIVRRSHADKVSVNAPVVDQTVVDSFARIADRVEEEFVKPTLEELLRERHGLEPDQYPQDLVFVCGIMDEYVKVMSRGSNSTNEQHATQVGRLNMAYIRALRSKDVLVTFDAILWYFSYYESEAFRSELPYRGMAHYMFGSADQLKFCRHITAIAQTIGDIKTRNKRLRELDFNGAIANVPDSFEKQRVGLTSFINFYTAF